MDIIGSIRNIGDRLYQRKSRQRRDTASKKSDEKRTQEGFGGAVLRLGQKIDTTA